MKETNELTNERKAELVFILDRSGSMSGLESDTVGGYNAMMAKQREAGGDITVTTVLFDDRYELLHDRVRLDELKPMTNEEYFVRGSTALIDAIGKTIMKIEKAQSHVATPHKADKVIFVITTDGHENASHRFRAEDVKRMVEQKREADGWEFIFLGANIDAVETAKHYGIKPSRSANYWLDGEGIAINAQAVGDTLCCMMNSTEALSDEEMAGCLSEIDKYHRSKKKG